MRVAARVADSSPAFRRGLTLLELVVVLAVLAALASMLVPILDNVSVQSRQVATMQTMRQVQEAIVNRYATDMKGYIAVDTSNNFHFTTTATGTTLSTNLGLPVPDPLNATVPRNLFVPQLAFLFLNPLTYDQTQSGSSSSISGLSLGWHGPYMGSGSAFPAATASMPNGNTAQGNGFYATGGTSIYGYSNGGSWIDPTPIDAWGSPIVVQLAIPSTTSSGTVVSPYSYATTVPTALTTWYPSFLTGIPLTYAVIVSAGPDGVLNSGDDIMLKVQ
ncbi:MAG TPA: prepilin-type N-terminal cleavage/methylation domain-containing protein [Pirellulales bacterium]|nr:prepilin-type N-terminal cleavage/methylation domain-containing protein [Pirellulales bacterium]